jgi:hypothetical protein
MNRSKAGQFAANFLIILSFFVSSVSACVCSAHHTENLETEMPSCHEHSEKVQKAEPDSAEQLDANDECCCVQSGPRVFSKSETLKIEKQSVVLPLSRVDFKTVSPVVLPKGVYFEKPFYLSDSFYNLKSPRAPPRS